MNYCLNKTFIKLLLVSYLLILFARADCDAQISVYAEGAYASVSYSDISVPKSKANEFSLTDDLDADSLFAYRAEIRYMISANSRLEFLIAPLSVTAAGVLPKDLVFNGKTFNKGDSVEGLFRFDSYRVRYRYFFKKRNKYLRSIGFTAKIRDAEIELKTPVLLSRKLNTGFVPLLNFIVCLPANDSLELELKGDALFSKFGRAEDVMLSLKYRLDEDLTFNGGYRVVEGGSDVDEVYSFTWINYFLLGIEYRL